MGKLLPASVTAAAGEGEPPPLTEVAGPGRNTLVDGKSKFEFYNKNYMSVLADVRVVPC